MDEIEVRSRLGSELRRPVTDSMWEYLTCRGYVAETVEGLSSISRLAASVRELEAAVLGGSQAPHRPAAAAMVVGDLRDGGAHQWALSVVVAAYARDDWQVKAFRESVLKGELLDWGDVPAWIEARAEERLPYYYITVALEAGDEDAASRETFTAPRAGASYEVRMLRYTARGEEHVRMTAVRPGVLAVLYEVAEALSTSYAWSLDAATVFLLTDVVPYIPSVIITSGGERIREGRSLEWSRRIRLDIDPSTTPEEVARDYQQARRNSKQDRRRRLSDKHAMLAAFVATTYDTWEKKRRSWNERHPDWSYSPSQLGNFRRDAYRAQARLLYPDWFRNQQRLRPVQVRGAC